MMRTILLIAVIASTTALDLPSNFKTCKKSDPKVLECIADAVKDAVVSLAKGLKSFKILPIDPLVVDSLKIGESQGSVSLKQEYRNVKIYGLTKDLQVYNYTIDWDNLIFRSESFNPQVDFVADYKLDGKILLLPIRGEGKCNISIHDLITKHEIHYEKFQKDGETYMRSTKYMVNFIPKHVSLHFDNLFNGDNILGEQMHRFLNENSDLIFKELEAPYEETFGLVFTKLTNDIFSRVPMNKIFK
ncbi:protein takeout-like [Temnothorax curvispinosus]|uniref:Protein takeout-like n=1 Tax=Temnothorax curvispinosus TaxID=300111 RepID=A0A6J1Q5K9_9HYME|nr:protein takeout-like [Temnothorax curvispinosus]XP_024876965.1 protein takeout-like [Temnothorax curvispinosus]